MARRLTGSERPRSSLLKLLASERRKPTIRLVENRDYAQILQLARIVAAEENAFPWEASSTGTQEEEDGREALLVETWLPEPGQRREVFVCEVDGECVGIAGVYVLQPNGLGRCSHIAKGAYMVAPGMRRQGLGQQMCAHSLGEAQKRHYVGMQLDMVVATNTAAIKACTSCGFKIMCTLPGVFCQPEGAYLDAHIMFNDFNAAEAAEQRGVGRSSAADLTFSYPAADAKYVVGTEVHLLPQPMLSAEAEASPTGLHSRFKVEPPLPEGLVLCPHTGTIHGSATRPCPEATYRITAEASGEVTFQVTDMARGVEGFVHINEVFASQLETVVDAADMPREPARTRFFGDWMIWMVHRAWLNDPTLVDFNFDNAQMPAPHLEPRIAPKLMKAMLTNTHIQVLSLSNSYVQKSTALELADALRQNCTVRILNLEGNCLDSNSIRELAVGVRDNSSSQLEHLRLQHQQGMRQFGRPAEEAVGQMMQRNETIVKLGFDCDDAHWRNSIDRALVRNNDFSRRRQHAATMEDTSAPAEEKTLGQLALQASPIATVSDFFSDDNPCHGLLRAYLAQNLQLPTTAQLQQYAKNSGTSMTYTMAGPLVRQCRSWLLDKSLAAEVLVVDAFGMSAVGTLKAWSENGEHWTVDVDAEEGGRLIFRADREPPIFLSDLWTSWLSRAKPASDGGA